MLGEFQNKIFLSQNVNFKTGDFGPLIERVLGGVMDHALLKLSVLSILLIVMDAGS